MKKYGIGSLLHKYQNADRTHCSPEKTVQMLKAMIIS